MSNHTESPQSPGPSEITLQKPGDLVTLLPALLGYHPDDSVVLAALHGPRGRLGGRIRFDIPANPGDWASAASSVAGSFVRGCERRGPRPDAIVLFLCQDPDPAREPVPAQRGTPVHGPVHRRLGTATGGTGREVMERLRPLAQRLRVACGALDVPVVEALCVSGGRWWSYTCPGTAGCCPPEGTEIGATGSGLARAAAALTGVPVGPGLREQRARLSPVTAPEAVASQTAALDAEAGAMLPRMLEHDDAETVRHDTVRLAAQVLERFRTSPPEDDGPGADSHDNSLLTDDEAARLILGLQDREARDRAAEWQDAPYTTSALRLWRALARRCVGPFREHAAAPLTLAGLVSWAAGDEAGAHIALGQALGADPQYTLARLLHAVLNESLDPEPVLRGLRRSRARRRLVAPATDSAQRTTRRAPAGAAGRGPGRNSSGGRRARTRS
jgi:hypothetical protein